MENNLEAVNKISGFINVTLSTSTVIYVQEETTTKNKKYNYR